MTRWRVVAVPAAGELVVDRMLADDSPPVSDAGHARLGDLCEASESDATIGECLRLIDDLGGRGHNGDRGADHRAIEKTKVVA